MKHILNYINYLNELFSLNNSDQMYMNEHTACMDLRRGLPVQLSFRDNTDRRAQAGVWLCVCVCVCVCA